MKPKTRADCINGPRPCPYATCRHHLQTDIDRFGRLIIYWPDIDDMPETCALDVVDQCEEYEHDQSEERYAAAMSHAAIGAVMNRTQQLVETLINKTLERLAKRGHLRMVAELARGESIERTVRRMAS